MKLGSRRQYRQVFLILLLCILASCRGNREEIVLDLPMTPPLSRKNIGYGVINVSFALIMEEPGQKNQASSYGRRGSIVEIQERRFITIENRTELWVLVAGTNQNQEDENETSRIQGWILETNIDVYDKLSQARTAAKAMNP
ncbi:MAG: hypothetical protein LBK83_15155 [Treponema sp.]|nr:hypothetical protein [Treponema sp.]